MEYTVQKYLHKIIEMGKDFNPVAPKLKFKMPSMKVTVPAIVEDGMDIDIPLIRSPADSEAAIAATPTSKPKKEKVKKEATKVVEPAKILNPAFDRARKVLKRLFAQKISFWFKTPVDPVALNLPTYTTIVKTPMDLGTVKKKLDNDEYATEEDFATDVRLTFGNSLLFNPAGSQVSIDANILLLKFNREITMNDFDGPKGFPDNALQIIDKLLESEHSAIFRFPVDANLYPEYYEIITEPIDIQTITVKLNEEKYVDLNQFHDDVQLIFKNCFTFNKKGTFGYAAGSELQNLYQKLIKPYAKSITNQQAVKPKVTVKTKATPVKVSTPVKQNITTSVSVAAETPQVSEEVLATPTPTLAIPTESPSKIAFKPIKLKMKLKPLAPPPESPAAALSTQTPEQVNSENISEVQKSDDSMDVVDEPVQILKVKKEELTEKASVAPVAPVEPQPPTEAPKKLKLKFKLSSK
ncbi:hypothetical protein HDV01_003573 [Terramyces sp. JEL0728]|nr:hypothetical protein HDV01_003573 [Terramyces sp. JEL0728]